MALVQERPWDSRTVAVKAWMINILKRDLPSSRVSFWQIIHTRRPALHSFSAHIKAAGHDWAVVADWCSAACTSNCQAQAKAVWAWSKAHSGQWTETPWFLWALDQALSKRKRVNSLVASQGVLRDHRFIGFQCLDSIGCCLLGTMYANTYSPKLSDNTFGAAIKPTDCFALVLPCSIRLYKAC